MFINELKPIAQEFTKQPLAFLGGFCSGVLKLNLGEDPLASWLKQQGIKTDFQVNYSSSNSNNRPQSIEIE